jgi:hypothetical protein
LSDGLAGTVPLVGSMPGIPAPATLVVPNVRWAAQLYYDDTPPSLNKVGSRGASKEAHWSFTDAKQEWQQTCEQMLMLARVPRGMTQAFAGARMRFPTRKGRDSGNYQTLLEKSLGDALVNYRAIPDDTAEQFCFAGVEFERERGPNRTTIVLWLTDTEV